MNPVAFFESSVWTRLALCLLHFVWQGTVLVVVAWACACAFGRHSARVRYGACVGLLMLFGSIFGAQDSTVQAAFDAKARISMIFSEEEGRDKSYRWGVSREASLKVIQGWLTYDNEGIKEHGGGGRNVAEADPMQLTLTVTRDGDTLAFHRGTVRIEDTGTLTADVGGRTAWPNGAALRTHFLSESEELTDTLQPLWKGELVLDGAVVKTLVYGARVVEPDEPMALFDVHDTSEALRICRAWGPEQDPAKKVYNGRTIDQWMAQWGTRDYQQSQKAKAALIEIGGPAVPALLNELKQNGSHSGYARSALGSMGPEAEPALDWLISTALDKRARDPKDKQRLHAMICLADMTWASDRLLPVFAGVALDRANEESVRTTALSGLGKIGLPARAVVEKVVDTASGALKGTAHGILAKMLTEAGLTTKPAYYARAVEQDPFDETVPRLLTSSKGTVNQGKPHALTQSVKQRVRTRLSGNPDAQLAMNLAKIIQNSLMSTELEWAAPTDRGSGQWHREDPAESFQTLGEVLELGLSQAERGSDLHTEFGLALAKQALLAGDWDRMNLMLRTLGQTPVPDRDRAYLPAPPADWQAGLGPQWQPCDESMRNGNCSLEFVIAKQGQPLAGVHVLVKKTPEPARGFTSGIAADTLFFAPYPLKARSDAFGYRGKDRQKTRYAVTDATGRVRFDRLPEIPIKIEVLVPTGNFREPGSSWDLWMEVEPGQFKMARLYSGPDTVSPGEAPAVVTLKPGQTVQYPRLVVRPAFALNVADWDPVNRDSFVLTWQGMDDSVMKEQGMQYELDMHLCTPSQSPGRAEDMNPIVKTVQKTLTQNRWPVGAQGVEGMRLVPGNIYMFEVRAVDAQGIAAARWPKTRVFVPWIHRQSDAPVARDRPRLGPPIYNKVWHRGSFDYGDGNEETLRQKVARLVQETPDAFEWEYLELGQAWLAWDDGRVDSAREQLARLAAALPRGNLVRGTAVSLLAQIKQGEKAPRRLAFVPDEPESGAEVPDARDASTEAPMSMAPGFNIYLLENEKLTWDDCNSTPLDELTLRPEPWIRSSDILRYDKVTHHLTFKRPMPSPPHYELATSGGRPFVVSVADARCYLGELRSPWHGPLRRGIVPTVAACWTPSSPPTTIRVELSRIFQSREASTQPYYDVRRDARVVAALEDQGVYHAGLSLDMEQPSVLNEAGQSSLTYTYTLTNRDRDSLYVLDPDKMKPRKLLSYFHPGPQLRPTEENKFLQEISGTRAAPDSGILTKACFTLVLPGQTMTRTVTSKSYPFIPPGEYDWWFGFRSPREKYIKGGLAQFDAPLAIDRAARGAVTVLER
jgi:hypothetical protein